MITPYLGISRPVRWYLCGSFFLGMSWATFALLLNLYFRELGHTESFIGRIWSFQSIGIIIMTFPAAALISRYSARWLIVCSALLAALGYALLAVADIALVMMCASLGIGLMVAIPRVTSAPFFMDHTGAAERSHVFSLQFATSLGAGLFAYFGGGWLHQQLAVIFNSKLIAYRILLLAGAGSALTGALVYLGIPGGIVVKQNRTRLSRWQRVKTKGPLLFRLTFPFFVIGLGAGLIIPFLNLYFRDRFGMEPLAIGFYYGLVQSSMLLGVLFGPYLARRIGMIRTVVYTELVSLPFMVLLAYSTNLHLAVGAFVIRGALMNMGIPIATNYAMERVGREDRAIANGLGMMAWSTSWALATWIGGALIEHIGYTEPLLIAGGLYLIAAILYYWFFHNEEIYAGSDTAPPQGRLSKV